MGDCDEVWVSDARLRAARFRVGLRPQVLRKKPELAFSGTDYSQPEALTACKFVDRFACEPV